jgi:hypothetical protein
MNQEELLSEMERLVEAGDEKAFERFVLDHFTEFPEDVQGKLLLNFYTETVEKQAGEAVIADIQKEGLDAIAKIDEIERSAGVSEQ